MRKGYKFSQNWEKKRCEILPKISDSTLFYNIPFIDILLALKVSIFKEIDYNMM